MATAYTKEFLIAAASYRFLPLGLIPYEKAYRMAVQSWNDNSLEDFKKYNTINSKTLATFKEWLLTEEGKQFII